jgi:polysaccharide biosynthesis protein VpsM
MTSKFTIRMLVAGVALAVGGPAAALEPASLGQGALKFTPTLDVMTGYDDNFRADPSGDSSWVTTIQPNFLLSTEQGPNRYSALYSIAQEFIHDDSDEDNTNQALDLAAELELNVRNRLDLGAFWNQTEEITSVGEPSDEFTNTGFSAIYGFGAPGAVINADLGYLYDRKRSDNDANKEDERDRDTYSATLYYGIGPRTQALAEVRYRDSDFRSANNLDNNTISYFVGARWEATAMTTGSARIGYSKQDFDLAGKPDETGNVWEIGLTWAPLTYSRVSLNTSRSIEDGDDGASSIDSTQWGIRWDHDWSGRLASNVGFAYTDDDYDNGRDDDLTNFNAGVTYSLRRWMDVGLQYDYEDSDSNLPSETWDRNRFMLLLNMSL